MKLVILDRDGTINVDTGGYIRLPHEWEPLPGALEAIARLNHAGWHVVVASNQSGLGRGLYDVGAINVINARMHKLLAAHGGRIDAVFFCPHAAEEHCHCRKPQPGMFEQIRERFNVDLKGVPAVGDRLDDALAAAAVGCEPHLVLTCQGAAYRDRPLPETFPAGTRVHKDLAAFAEHLISRTSPAR